MKVQDVIDMAAYGELRDLGLRNDVPTVLSYINLGLLELYKRFSLSTKEIVIELQNNVEIYDMPVDYMWIVAAYGEVPINSTDTINSLPINVENNPVSINTINWYQVQIPNSIEGARVSLIYVAKPDMLIYNEATPDTLLQNELPLPDQLIEALLSYMAYRAYGTINNENQSESNVFYRKFEEASKRVKRDGVLTSDDLTMKTRIKTRGFV